AVAVLSANYIAHRLGEHFPVLYRGHGGLVAHECILDVRELTKRSGVSVDDVAKRLIDHGFHAPTMSFPVAGTLMIEPTESEDLRELERFCDAMIAIRAEIDARPELLRNAPHTAAMLLRDPWEQPYTREEAAFPVPEVRTDKYWPPVRRIDGGYGDRNLMCSCPPISTRCSARGGRRPSVVMPRSLRVIPRSFSAARAARPRKSSLSQPTTHPSPACNGVMPGPSSWPCSGRPDSRRNVSRAPNPAG